VTLPARAAPALALLALLLPGCTDSDADLYCGSTSRSGRPLTTLYVNNGAEPTSLDPGLAQDDSATSLLFQLFEGLTTYHPEDLHPTQGIAERWDQSADGLFYRFHLRADARWSDGKPITAGDFVYAWKRVLRPATASFVASTLYVLRNGERFHKGEITDDAAVGVRARDDLTLDVALERPTPYFLDLTSFPTLAPVRQDVIEPFAQRGEMERWTRPESMVVSGPYMLESWRFRDAITMKPNPFHRSREALRVERVVWLEAESAFTAMNLYKSGEIDVFGDNLSIPAEYVPQIAPKRDFRRVPQLATFWCQLNVRRPPLDDIRVRRALALSVDKQLLTATVARRGLPADHYVPDAISLGYAAQARADRAAGMDPFSGPGVGFDPERARALLREAGYALSQTAEGLRAVGFPPLELLTNNNEGTRKFAVAIQDMWRKHLGITLGLRSEEWKVMLEDRRQGKFQIIANAWTADYSHPHTFLDPFLSTSPQNPTGWQSPAFDEALREAAAELDPAESIRRYRRAEHLALEGMARIPLYFLTGTALVKPYVRGWFAPPRNIHLAQFAWIDPDFRRGGEDRPAFAPRELPPPGLLSAELPPRAAGAW
jgi:oligopeptide transport system substrate-binding protein